MNAPRSPLYWLSLAWCTGILTWLGILSWLGFNTGCQSRPTFPEAAAAYHRHLNP